MKYFLRKSVLAEVPEIEISKSKYIEYKRARKVLSNCFEIEEKYEILISNYLEFETQLLNATAIQMVRRSLDYSDLFQFRLALNIRLINFLTSARLYVDRMKENVKECVPELPDAKKLVEAQFSKEYEKHPEYRFMEALRNYAQHRGLPVHWTSQGGKWTNLRENGFLEFSTELASLRSSFEEDKTFKRSVLEELDEKMDLKAAIRCYVESISNVHAAARQIIEKSVVSSRELLEDAHKQYASVYSGNLVGLSACVCVEGKQTESTSLLLDWDDVRMKLQKRNPKATNLKKRYVTGKLKTHNE